MESMTLKSKELEKEILEFSIKIEEDKKSFESLELEISQVKFMKNEATCSFNDYSRRSENIVFDLKSIHEAYQNLPKQSMEEYIQCEILKRKEKLLEEKQKAESRLGLLKLKRSGQKEKLEDLRLQAVIQQKKRKALVLKLQNNISQSEVARKEAMIKLAGLKKEELLIR